MIRLLNAATGEEHLIAFMRASILKPQIPAIAMLLNFSNTLIEFHDNISLHHRRPYGRNNRLRIVCIGKHASIGFFFQLHPALLEPVNGLPGAKGMKTPLE